MINKKFHMIILNTIMQEDDGTLNYNLIIQEFIKNFQ